jgi:hypothetical protein
VDNITELMPHFVVELPNEVHVICIADIRRLANGEHYCGDAVKMIQLLATIIKDVSDDHNSL